jgi:hypothetical protein
MLAALEPFTQYITYLAKGKLDGYFNSIRPEDLVTDLEVQLPTRPMLLLHDLGKYTNKETIEHLFAGGTVFVVFLASFSWRMTNANFAWCSHLFAVSGSGKTRRTLEGLCHNWGFYISCQVGSDVSQKQTTGSRDFESVTELMKSMSRRDGTGEADITKNVAVADRAFAMLICARVFVLKHLLKNLPINTDATEARRRWVLAQVLPPSLQYDKDDLFTVVVRSLRSADTTDMLKLARTMLRGMAHIVGGLFAVVDEAQVAAVYLKDSFRSLTTGTDMRPVLHAFYGFLWKSGIFQGVILAGTGLSMKMVKNALSSQVAKYTGSREPIVSVELGRFTKDDTSHVDYIRKYSSLSGGSFSDQRLVERILYWLSGR